MTGRPPDLLADLHHLATGVTTVVEFDAGAEGLLAAPLGADLARRVISGDLPAPADDGPQMFAVHAAAMVSVCRELVESRQRQRSLEQMTASRDEFCRLLLESSGEGIYGIDLEGRCTFINATGVRLLGFGDAAEVLGRDMHDLVHHTRVDGLPYPVAECGISAAHREGRGVVRDDEVFFRPDGSSFPTEYRSDPIVRHGQVEGSVLTFTDITERRRTTAELEQSRTLQMMAGRIAGLGGWSVDLAEQEVVWSDELYAILGHPRELEAELQDGLSRYIGPDRLRVEEAMEKCGATGSAFDLEARLETYDGRQVWVRVMGWPRFGPDGTVTHISGAFQDIDQLKASTTAAEELNDRLTATLESITDAFWTVDRDWCMTYINRRAEELLHRTREELLGADLWESFPEAVGSVLDEVYRRARRTGVSEVIEEFHWSPLDIWLDIHVYSSGEGLAVYFRDVSDQRKTRLELRERDARVAEQATLLDKARDAIVVRDLDHRVMYWNHGAERLFGFSAAEALGHSLRELIVLDGDEFDRAHASLLEHDEWVGQIRDVAKDGSEVIVEAHWTLVRDDGGQPTSVLSIKSDVTERRRLEQQLLRTQRLDSLGTLAGGIAHDLNNMLAPILLAAQLIELSTPDEHVTDMLSIIEQSAQRGAEMVRQVLLFARGGEGERVEVDLGVIVDRTTTLLRECFPKDIQLRIEHSGPLPAVSGDPTQLQQVLMNLCINARDAMPDGGLLDIHLGTGTVTDDAIAHECPPGDYLTVRVEDTGNGMDPATLERVFEPFFTTKPQGQGTGLGLPTSLGIVRGHGGFIQLFSTPGAGTTFVLHLPVASGAACPSAVGGEVEPPRGRRQLLLLIEDEDDVRRLTRRILERHGYRVVEAADGRDALRVFDEHGADIEAVITDMTMPTMNGPTVIEHLLARAPTIPILAVTGLVTGPEAARSAELGVTHFLDKPFSTAHLCAAVARLLAGGPPMTTPQRGETSIVAT